MIFNLYYELYHIYKFLDIQTFIYFTCLTRDSMESAKRFLNVQKQNCAPEKRLSINRQFSKMQWLNARFEKSIFS